MAEHGITSEVAHAQVRMMLEHFKEGQHEQPLAPMPSWITDEGLYITVGDSTIKIGFMARGQLRLSPELIETAAEVCRRLQAGHVWLSAGADEDNWCLMWGLKVPLVWLSEDTLQQMVYSALISMPDMQQALDGQFAQFGGRHDPPTPGQRNVLWMVTMGHM